MALLSRMARMKLPTKAFALPGRRYPIHDQAHARAALGRVAQWGTPHERSAVRAAVRNRFPSMMMGAHAVKPRGATVY
jgi:hypothetical protein